MLKDFRYICAENRFNGFYFNIGNENSRSVLHDDVFPLYECLFCVDGRCFYFPFRQRIWI